MLLKPQLLRNTNKAINRLAFRSFSNCRALRNIDEDNNNNTPADKEFPWLLSTSEARLDKQPYFHTGSNPFTSWLPKTWQDSLFSFMVKKFISDYTNLEYFLDEMPMGAALGTEQALEFISKGDLENMKHIMTPDLYERYSKALEVLKQNNQTVNLSLKNPTNAEVIEYWANIGPQAGLDPRNTQYDVNFVRSAILISKAQPSDNSGFVGSVKSTTQDYAKGFQLEVDVALEADIAYTLTQNPTSETPAKKLIDDNTRRQIVLSFKSQAFEPIPLDINPSDWDWKLSDIDYLLRSETLKERTKWYYMHKQNFINNLKGDQNE